MESWLGVKKDSALGKVYNIRLNNIERYHLCILLHHISDPTFGSHLKTVYYIQYSTLKSTCKAHRLLENDKHWDFTLEEATLSWSPYKMWKLFIIMLVWCHFYETLDLWEKYKDNFLENIKFNIYRQQLHNDPALIEEYIKFLVKIEDYFPAFGWKEFSEVWFILAEKI